MAQRFLPNLLNSKTDLHLMVLVFLNDDSTPTLTLCGTALLYRTSANTLGRWQSIQSPLDEPREVAIVLKLQLFLHPVVPRYDLSADWSFAVAIHFAVLVVNHGIVACEFLIRTDVTQGDESYLALDAQVRVTRVVKVHHASLALRLRRRADEQVFGDLNLGWPKTTFYFVSLSLGHDVASFYDDDLILGDGLAGEETLSIDVAAALFGF